MSRTYKDMPWRVLKARPDQRWRYETTGYPPAIAGAWKELGRYTNRRNRQQRRHVKLELMHGREPHPWHKWPRDVKWDIW